MIPVSFRRPPFFLLLIVSMFLLLFLLLFLPLLFCFCGVISIVICSICSSSLGLVLVLNFSWRGPTSSLPLLLDFVFFLVVVTFRRSIIILASTIMTAVVATTCTTIATTGAPPKGAVVVVLLVIIPSSFSFSFSSIVVMMIIIILLLLMFSIRQPSSVLGDFVLVGRHALAAAMLLLLQCIIIFPCHLSRHPTRSS